MIIFSHLVVGFVLCLFAIYPANAGTYQPDKKNGQFVFSRCQICHAIETTSKKSGPKLKGLFGRKAAGISDFDYSPAMKSSGIIWTEKNLDQFLKNPADFIPGTVMIFNGIFVH